MEKIRKVPWTFFFSHPLFSCFISLYSLFLIYFPHHSFGILLSPVPLLTGAFLISFLRVWSIQESNTKPGSESTESSIISEFKTGLDPNPEFMEWNLKLGSPLEVIHEEDEEAPSMTGVKDPTRFVSIERFTSLSILKPESNLDCGFELDRDFPVMVEKDFDPGHIFKPESDLDYGFELNRDFPVLGEKDSTRFPSLSIIKPDFDTDSDSEMDRDFPVMYDWISPEKVSLRWEDDDEEEGEGLIEIKLDKYFNGYQNKMMKQNQIDLDFLAEEESLIEIDISS